MRSPNDFGDAETGIKPWLTAGIRMGMHFCEIRWARFIGARLNATRLNATPHALATGDPRLRHLDQTRQVPSPVHPWEPSL